MVFSDSLKEIDKIMMRSEDKTVMVCVSGGADSALMLYELLIQTSLNVVAVHINEGHYMPMPNGHHARERKAFERIVDYLRIEVRPFVALHGRTVMNDINGQPYKSGGFRPTRHGCKDAHDSHWRRCRYTSIGYNANLIGAKSVVMAFNSWERRMGKHLYDEVEDLFREHTNAALLYPWLDYDEETGGWTGRSKAQVFRDIPEELLSLTIGCQKSGFFDWHCDCATCAFRKFWFEICRPNLEKLGEIEERVSKNSCLGKYFNKADPETYHNDLVLDVIRDIDGWKQWMKGTDDDPRVS